MIIIVGLGNPGKKYEKTRHNVGFMALDLLRHDLHAPEFKLNEKFNAEITLVDNLANNRITDNPATNRVADSTAVSKVILLKPQTYMNESGKAVSTIADYYKIAVRDILVIYDDIDLPIGTIRIGQFDSSAGHKGVQSIINYLKSNEFIRFRVGIKNSQADKQSAEKFVLQKFDLLEKKKINEAMKKTVEAIKLALTEPLDKVMNKYN